MKQNFHKLYSQLVHILRVDYAGIAECGESFTPRYYTQAIGQAWNDGRLDELLFLRYVNQMLACTGDRHLKLALLPGEGYEPYSTGFRVRRFGDDLYVTEVLEDERFAVGDRITAINGGSPAYHRLRIEKNFFYADTPEREDWSGFLKMADSVDVDGKGTLELRQWPKAARMHAPSLRVEGQTVIVYPGDFDGSNAAAEMLEGHAPVLEKADRIVWDLRGCGGVSEEDAEALLPWLIPVSSDAAKIVGDTELFVNYSPLNCSLKAQQLRGVRGAEAYVEELKSKAGSGFVAEKAEAEHRMLTPRTRAKSIVVTDTWCRDAAESFVLMAKRAGAVLVGRPSMGTLDYCGDVSVMLGERFVLSWPTAVTAAARGGNGMKGRGIAPDLYIPFTPQECGKDLLLAAAMNE